jgi:hypothetical protein
MLPSIARGLATNWAYGDLDEFGQGRVKELVYRQSLRLVGNRKRRAEFIPLDSKWCRDFRRDILRSEILSTLKFAAGILLAAFC